MMSRVGAAGSSMSTTPTASYSGGSPPAARSTRPGGLAAAPAGFGRFSNDLLVGDFGDGRINAYRPVPGGYHFDGQLLGSSRRPITIDGLWGLKFGPNAGIPQTLFFTAGPNDEENGLFGSLTPSPELTNDAQSNRSVCVRFGTSETRRPSPSKGRRIPLRTDFKTTLRRSPQVDHPVVDRAAASLR